MTVFEKIKAMNIDKFADWYDENCKHDDDPSIKWWDNKYCKNCEPVVGDVKGYYDRPMEFCWCEIYGKCKFFEDMDELPNSREMIKLWLESEE